MKIGLDTSVLVRLLTGEPEALASEAGRQIEAERKSGASFLVSDLVLAEGYFALQHHYGLTKREALEALSTLLQTSPVRPSGTASTVLETPKLATARPGFVDRLIHADYRRHVDAMWTFETAAAKLPATHLLAGKPRT